MADHRRRTVALTASAVLLAAAAGPATAHVAHGATLSLLSCEGAETLTFQPPLTNTARPTLVHFGIDLDLCPAGAVLSGDSEGSFTVTASCTTLSVLPPAFSDTYRWNTGATSTVS